VGWAETSAVRKGGGGGIVELGAEMAVRTGVVGV
jgi:hypothetical protein